MTDQPALPGVLPSGLRLRPVRVVDGGIDAIDLAAVTRLMTACDVAVIGEPDSGEADIAGMLAMPTMDRVASFLAFDGDTAVAFTWVENDATARGSFVDVFAPPGPCADEVRHAGLEIGLAAASRHHREAPEPGPWTVHCGAWLQDEEYAAVIVAHGLEPARRFYRMRIDSSSPEIPAVAPPLPAGVELVVRDDEETRRRVWALDMDSFSEHYNFHLREFDEWWEHWETSPTRDPAGWWLLTVDGEDAAVCLLDESRAELGEGYVAILGVRDEFRGRGLAKLLLQRAFVHYRDLGRGGTQLGVDADNTTGAVRVYESVGMAPTRAIQSYARELD